MDPRVQVWPVRGGSRYEARVDDAPVLIQRSAALLPRFRCRWDQSDLRLSAPAIGSMWFALQSDGNTVASVSESNPLGRKYTVRCGDDRIGMKPKRSGSYAYSITVNGQLLGAARRLEGTKTGVRVEAVDDLAPEALLLVGWFLCQRWTTA